MQYWSISHEKNSSGIILSVSQTDFSRAPFRFITIKSNKHLKSQVSLISFVALATGKVELTNCVTKPHGKFKTGLGASHK